MQLKFNLTGWRGTVAGTILLQDIIINSNHHQLESSSSYEPSNLRHCRVNLEAYHSLRTDRSVRRKHRCWECTEFCCSVTVVLIGDQVFALLLQASIKSLFDLILEGTRRPVCWVSLLYWGLFLQAYSKEVLWKKKWTDQYWWTHSIWSTWKKN